MAERSDEYIIGRLIERSRLLIAVSDEIPVETKLQTQPLLKQLEAADRSVDRKIRLLMRVRENAERRRAAGSSAAPPGGQDDSLSSPDGTPQLHSEVSGEDSPAPEHNPALATDSPNSNLEERSQNVDENKRTVMSDKWRVTSKKENQQAGGGRNESPEQNLEVRT